MRYSSPNKVQIEAKIRRLAAWLNLPHVKEAPMGADARAIEALKDSGIRRLVEPIIEFIVDLSQELRTRRGVRVDLDWWFHRYAVNRLLEVCRVYPQLEIPSRQGWKITWHPGRRLHEDSRDRIRVLQTMVSYAERGWLRLLRRCRQCQRWFCARDSRKKFCSDSCRKRDYRQSEAGRAKRRAYMKRYMRKYRQANF
jgi:hypothetical protein